MAPPTFFCSNFCKNGHINLWSFSKFLFGKCGHYCLPGPHGRQRDLKVGRGRQKYEFLYDGDIHF